MTECVGAGVCKSVCPVDVYELVEMPEYNNEIKAVSKLMEDCIMCMACINGYQSRPSRWRKSRPLLHSPFFLSTNPSVQSSCHLFTSEGNVS